MLLAYAAFGDTLRGENRVRCIERAEQAMSGPEFLTEEASTSFLVVIQVLLYADQLDPALRVMKEARSLAERRGSPGSYALASTGIARVLHDMGRLLEAEADIDGVLEACPEDQPVARAYLATTLAHVLLKRGDLAAAERALAQAGFDRRSVPRSLLAANPLTVHGLLHLAQGDWQSALADFVAIGDLLEPAGCRNPAIARWRSGAALALVHLGRQDEARSLAEEELELSTAATRQTCARLSQRRSTSGCRGSHPSSASGRRCRRSVGSRTTVAGRWPVNCARSTCRRRSRRSCRHASTAFPPPSEWCSSARR
jgi:ATP/maltotriose-dependent transcriptional regulator MalT